MAWISILFENSGITGLITNTKFLFFGTYTHRANLSFALTPAEGTTKITGSSSDDWISLSLSLSLSPLSPSLPLSL
jgi:hypothetical protein